MYICMEIAAADEIARLRDRRPRGFHRRRLRLLLGDSELHLVRAATEGVMQPDLQLGRLLLCGHERTE
jgi:hypothetical protein